MVENDIYDNQGKYESSKANLELLLLPPEKMSEFKPKNLQFPLFQLSYDSLIYASIPDMFV